MQLSGDLFQQIINQLKSSITPSDRRDGPRVGMRNRVNVALLGGDDKTARLIEVGITDLSPGGIGLVHHVALPPDTIFAIRLPVHGSRDMTVVYKVKNCRQLSKAMFRIGAMVIKTDDPNHAAQAPATPARADPSAARAAAVAVTRSSRDYVV